MKITVLAALIATYAVPAFAGEQFVGTHTYRFEQEAWAPMPGNVWQTLTMVGDFEPISGPIPAGRIECRGANFRAGPAQEANGVCVFGEGRDVWMLRYRMTRNDIAAPSAERFRRIGEWTVVGGTGRYNGMTGEGFYWAEEGAVADAGRWRTRWGGEVTIPK
jgi:hypothetical protein